MLRVSGFASGVAAVKGSMAGIDSMFGDVFMNLSASLRLEYIR
jgi:hypothetical protein